MNDQRATIEKGSRRSLCIASLSGALLWALAPLRLAFSQTRFAPAMPGYDMRFPEDEGAHPDFRLEWWYVTGWLNHDTAHPLGFQVTFFRARPALEHDNPSAFAPHHILLAHAALSDPGYGRLASAQRAARAGFDLAQAEVGQTRVWIDDWSLTSRRGGYRAAIPGDDWRFDLVLTPTQPPLLQGDGGYSRKGPAVLSASYYYSVPHLAVSGIVTQRGRSENVNGTAWLDHEWSSQYMDKAAVGWDWIGINLDGGAALMLFQMRDRDGGQYWAGGTLRYADGRRRVFGREEIRFDPLRRWRSPRTGVRYPVAWRVEAGEIGLAIDPLMDDQEQDARTSSGTIYWEGAVRALREGKTVGRGYLELTGYWRPMNLT